MKCKVKYTEVLCPHEGEKCLGIKDSDILCCDRREKKKGYDGEIEEFEIEKTPYWNGYYLKINKRRTLELYVDLYGNDETCDSGTCYIDFLEIDGDQIV